MRHLSEARDVKVALTGTFPIEAIGAVQKKIYTLEKQYINSLDANGVSQNLDDIAGAYVVLTGNTPYQIYVFTLGAVFATGTYTFTFLEKAPNVETATYLIPS